MEIYKTCTKCKESKKLDKFGKDKYLKDKHCSRCKECKKKESREYSRTNPEKIKAHYANNREVLLAECLKYNKTVEGKYRRAVARNKKKGFTEVMTLEQYKQVVSSGECFYCKEQNLPAQGAGLDRVDSSKPYILENVVPCCETCNQAKNSLSTEDFFSHIHKIFINHIHLKAEYYE